MRTTLTCCVLLPVLVLALGLGAHAQNERVNEPFEPDRSERVDEFLLDPSGQRVAFVVENDVGQLALYLSGDPGVPGTRRFTTTVIHRMGFSPDGSHLLVIAGTFELFSLEVSGSGFRRLDAFSGPRRGVDDFRVTPDGTRVVFRGSASGSRELYVVPIDGSAPPEQMSLGTEHTEIWNFEVAPDSNQVVFQADLPNFQKGLFRLRLDGVGGTVPLHQPGTISFFASDMHITDDSRHVIYRHNRQSPQRYELYATRLDGSGTPIKRDVFAGAGEVLNVLPVVGGRWILYRAERVAGKAEIFAVPIQSGEAILFSPAGLTEGVHAMQLDASGRRVLFATPKTLYCRALVPGSPTKKLSLALASAETLQDFKVAPGRVVYSTTSGLFAAPVDGSAPARDLGVGGSPREFVVGRDFPDVAYTLAPLGRVEVFRARLDAFDSPSRLSGTMRASQGVIPLASAAGGRFLYRAAEEPIGWSGHGLAVELHSVRGDGSGRVLLNPPLVATTVSGSVLRSEPTADGRTVVYSWFPSRFAFSEENLSARRADGTVRSLYPEVLGSVDPADWVLSPDSSRIVYRYREQLTSAGVLRLFVAPLEGGGPPRELASPASVPGELDTRVFQFTADGATFVFGAAVPIGSFGTQLQVYAVPVDGSAAPRRLNHALGADDSVTAAWIAPDGRHVVYEAAGLYTVPLDGSAAPVLLEPAASLELSARSPISPDSARVVFVRVRSAATQLVSLPIQGGAPIVLAALPALSSTVQVSPDGSTVLFKADPDGDDRFELASVPLAGTGPALFLGVFQGASEPFLTSADSCRVLARDGNVLRSAPLDASEPPRAITVSGQILREFELSPNSRWVVFVTQGPTSRHLYSAPLDGEGLPLELGSHLLPGGPSPSPSFRIAPDSRGVAFVADRALPGTFELFEARIDGSRRPFQVNPPLVHGGSVLGGVPPRFHYGQDRLYYLADQEHDAAVELFSTLLPRPRRR